jgi:hypothetical protein
MTRSSARMLARTAARIFGSVELPARYVIAGCTGSVARDTSFVKSIVITRAAHFAVSATCAKNSAPPPRFVPVSMITLGRVCQTISWYTIMSVGHLCTATPIHVVLNHVLSR